MKAHIIEKKGKPEYVIMSFDDYQRFLAIVENRREIPLPANPVASSTSDGNFPVPDEILRRKIRGESSVRLWRRYRDMTQEDLSQLAGISKSFISQIEHGNRQGAPDTLEAIARALAIPVKMLQD